MKRYLLTILAVATAFASCTKFVQDEDIEFAGISSPEVKATTVGDTEISVTITPADGTTYYSYVVSQGAARQLDATNLLQCKYESIAITVDEKKVSGMALRSETASVSLSLKGLVPNTTYTVYAVARNSQGVVSEVASASALTTDSTAPVIVDFDSAESESVMTFAVLFDDPVVATGEGEVTARFYAVNTARDADNFFVPRKEVKLSGENVFSQDGVLYFNVPAEEYIPGAYVGISWTADVAANALGAKIPAYTSTFGVADGSLSAKGVVARYKTVAFDLALTEKDEDGGFGGAEDDGGADGPAIFNDWKKLEMVSYARTIHPLAGFVKSAEVTVKSKDANGRTVSYPGSKYGVAAANAVAVMLDEDPGFGSLVSYTIAAGSVQDIYGNSNNEIVVEDGYFCSYGYKLEDVIGTYTFSSTSLYAEYGYGPYNNLLTIAASDNEKAGNVMFTGQLSDIDVKFYADFDMDAGTITLPEGPLVGTCVEVVFGEDDNPLVGDDGQYVTEEYDVKLYISNGQSLYTDQLGFDVPVAHQLDFWFAGQAYIALSEWKGANLAGVYDMLNLRSVTYTPDAGPAAVVAQPRSVRKPVKVEGVLQAL